MTLSYQLLSRVKQWVMINDRVKRVIIAAPTGDFALSLTHSRIRTIETKMGIRPMDT